MTDSASIEKTADQLVEHLRSLGRVAVAFSGGVDSTVVAKAASLALGEQAVAITADSPSVAREELELAKRIAAKIGIRHQIQATSELTDARYVANDGTRCYYCKSELYDQVIQLKETLGFDVICSGANTDDWGDYRPGLQAAAERSIRHPLQEVGINKARVRQLAQFWNLPNWAKPASPCLASRLAVGVEVSADRLQRVELAEQFLANLGFSPLRVRYHPGDHARVEVSQDAFGRFVEPTLREKVVTHLLDLGFKFVSLDLQEFRSGGLNTLVPLELRIPSGGGPNAG